LYACTGFIVMLMRSWSPRRLFIVSLTIIVQGSVLAVAPFLALEHAPLEIKKLVAAQMSPPGSDVDVPTSIAAVSSGLG
ncbi:hypothetical protein AB4142_38570, partial [Variovorax sp. 2RAF20]